MAPLTARGPTLTLRYPEPRDAAALFALAEDPAVTRFFSWRYTAPADAEAWIAGRAAAREAGTWLEWVVEHRDHGIAGVTGLTEPSGRDARAVTGTWLGRAFWGSGVNTEAKYLLLRHAFERMGCVRVQFKTDRLNVRSQTAIKRLGAVEEGTLRKHVWVQNRRFRDSVYFSILDDEWPAVKARIEGMMQPFP